MARLPFTLEQLRTFLAVARQESISGAAASLYLTQGAVSQQVANLEAALGLRLLERHGRRVRLTEGGRAVATACEATIRAVEGVSETSRRFTRLEAGSLHIGASPTAAASYLPGLLARFTRLYPTVRIKVVTENNPTVAASVASGVLDCAMVEGHSDHHTELVEREFAEDEVLVTVGPDHPLAARSSVTVADLLDQRYLGREPGAALEAMAMELLGPAYHKIQRMELGHLDAVRAAALAGLGFALLPHVAINRALEMGLLIELPFPRRRRWISLVRRAAEGSAVLEEFWRVAESTPPRHIEDQPEVVSSAV
jgi:DNA-binding transcriptional LysR family regulator